jgi:rsbT antagonist protein RsbS
MRDDIGAHVPLQLSRDCVIASIQIDLQGEALLAFRDDLLRYVATTRASGVIIDVSGLQIIDADDWDALRRTMAMTKLLGARPVITGLRPGVVSSLIELGVDVEGVETAPSLDEGFAMFDASDARQPAVTESEGAESEDESTIDEYEPGPASDTNRD